MAYIAVQDRPVFRREIEEMTKETPGSYEEFNPRFEKLLENDQCLKNAICKNQKIEMLAAGQTSVVFNFEPGTIGENSSISLELNVSDLNYKNITVDGDSVTVTFEAQEDRDVYVKVVVSDGLV